MKSVLTALSLTLTLIGSAAMAETTTYTVEGMHCSGCKHMISEKVCQNEKLKGDMESCEVTLTNAKKQIGTVKITPKKDKTINSSEVKSSITAAGEEYKVIKEETK